MVKVNKKREYTLQDKYELLFQYCIHRQVLAGIKLKLF